MKLHYNVWYSVFDEGDAGNQGDTGNQGDAGNQGNGGGDGGQGKSFSQDEVNKFLAEDRRKHNTKLQEALNELNALKAKASLTNTERSELDGRIETLQNELLTKDQLAKKNEEKMRKDYQKTLEGLSTERDSWKTRYETETIVRSITDASIASGAINPKQIVAILRPNTRLVEVLDEEGKPNGELVPKVKFSDTDKDGNPITLELSVSDTVKRMTDMDDYLNLFVSTGSAGVGGNPRRSGGSKATLRDLAKSTEAYRAARKDGTIKF